ncbi:kynurenine formamidase-like [Babylonia areolata]|uniref:kynurenine formamidase-like n=1 Tax=Babylonia areolata TaxID=304850 RepID=UPI003FD3047B
MSTIPDKELDYHYSPSRWSHRMGPEEVLVSHVKTMSDATREARWCLDVETDITYGSTPRQKLDVYTQKNSAGKKGSPFFVVLHGGYWQTKEIGHDIFGFMAQPLTAAGATVIPVGYELCPDVSMDEIISEVKHAMYFIFKLAKERHSSGIYLCGHSAGAHLAALMLMTSFQDEDAFDSELIKGAVLVSGVYDLEPLVKTSVNDALRLTEEDAQSLSPATFVKELSDHSKRRQILIAVGEYDPPEFRRQSGEFEKSLRNNGIHTRYLDIPDTDHFSVVEKLQDANYNLTKECIRLMNLPTQK